ncbi:SRPBCC family protein [Patescibacteria group bacterium]|nr:SRPBCC family protein [Patescibacteria group bacterium]
MLLALFIALLFAGIVFLGYVATLPNDFRYERSIVINASAERIFTHINDFKAWKAWSPWEKMDDSMKKEYSEPSHGTGATYSWSGNGKVGEGKMTITSSDAPNEIKIDLQFIKPFEAMNQTTFRFTPEAGGTRVTWIMTGTNPFTMKIFAVLFSMEKALQKDFDRGLAALKEIAENAG